METMGGRGLFLGMAASSYTLGATVPAVLPNGLTAQIGPAIVSKGRGAVG